MLGAFADQIARRMADNERRTVEPGSIDIECKVGPPWSIRGGYTRRTHSSALPCLSFQHEFKLFPHPDGRSLVQVAAMSRLPCDHPRDFGAEILAAIEGVKLIHEATTERVAEPVAAL
jgi:hypothetical protein